MHARYTFLFIGVGAVILCKQLPAQQAYFQEEAPPPGASAIKHVAGIAADKNNCIWFATQTGVYRYDGMNFRHYSVLNTPVLKFERLTSAVLRVNNNGYNWCLQDAKSNLYEVDSFSRLRPFSPASHPGEQLIYEKYYRITDPAKTKIAPALIGNILEKYMVPATQTVYLLLFNGQILKMSNHSFLKGGNGSLLYSFKNNFSHKEYYGTKTIATGKNFYVITESGLLRWGEADAQAKPVVLSGDLLHNHDQRIDYNKLTALKTADPLVILFWYDGNIYEAKETSDNTLVTRLLVKDKEKEQPLAVFYSSSLQLFISYYPYKGLTFYRPGQFHLLTASTPGATSNFDDYYYSLIPSGRGFITVNNSAVLWLGTKGERRTLYKGPCHKYFLYKDRAGNIWYHDGRNGISYLQADTGTPVQMLMPGDNNVLIGIYQPDDSTYYLLTSRMLRKIVVKENTIKTTELLYTATAGIEFNVLYPLNDHTLWLGSDRGLVEFNMAVNSSKNVTGPGNMYVRSAIRLSENNYLVGTYDRGIYQFSNNKWIQLLSREKNMPASAHAFIIDEPTSSVWVSSNEGIVRLSLQQLRNNNYPKDNITFGYFTSFGPDISSEFNGSSNVSGAKLSDTCIAFANANGLVMFDPSKLIYYQLPVNVLVESAVENDNDTLAKKASISNHIEFHPVVPYFGDRNDLDILYRLTNSNDGWHKLSPNAAITYNNVRPGDHDLQFRIRHNQDGEGKEVFLTAKSFYIPYRWYQRPWFFIVAITLALALLVSLHYLRIWYMFKRRRELQEQVKRKTTELHETNENLLNVIDELSASEAHLKQSNFLKDEYYAVLTHDIRSPLKFLSFNISQLLELQPALDSDTLKKGLYAAYQCSADLYKLIDEFVYWIRDNEDQLKLLPAPAVIEAVIMDTKKIYDFSFESNKNTFLTDVSPGLRFKTDVRLLFIVLRNAVDNANKYTYNGTIKVSALQQDGYLKMTVSDTGRGMQEALVKDLMELQHSDEQLSYKKRKSLGFYIMAMLIKKLGGHYSIHSIKEKGTTLDFMIPGLDEQ